ncbi:uncharacterized protein LOC123320995 [Coccinella septempunctata]|uniref:uncharacterized protein LOC123320995 n=1 Tax=Coccinella septempunctata TaxID=41139 RepID=UPI001D089978|nr:uncharacterized protein LOC123320995 [Coccinella septempunctata]
MAPTSTVDKSEALTTELNKINKSILIDILVQRSVPDSVTNKVVKKFFEKFFEETSKHETSSRPVGDVPVLTNEWRMNMENEHLTKQFELCQQLNHELNKRIKDQELIIKLSQNSDLKGNSNLSPNSDNNVDPPPTKNINNIATVDIPSQVINIRDGLDPEMSSSSGNAAMRMNINKFESRGSNRRSPDVPIQLMSNSDKYVRVEPDMTHSDISGLKTRTKVNNNKLFTGKASVSNSKMKGAPKFINIYVGRILGNVSEEDMEEFLMSTWPDIIIKCSQSLLKNEKITLCHLNARGVAGKESFFEMLLHIYENTQVMSITEHWLSQEEAEVFSLEGWQLAHSYNRKHFKRGGVLTLCRSHSPFVCLDEVNNLSLDLHCEISAIKLLQYDLILISIYRAPKSDFHMFFDNLEKIFGILSTTQCRVAFLGDFNLLFNSPDKNCKSFCDIMNCNGFVRTIFEPTRGPNCIDNIFINFGGDSGGYFSRVVEFEFSDHRAQLLEVNIPAGMVDDTLVKSFRPLTEEGMFSFHNVLSSLSWIFLYDGGGTVNDRFGVFVDVITDAFQLCFPFRMMKSRGKDGGVRWFTRELKSMRDDLHLLNDMYSHFRTDELKRARNNFRLKYKRRVKQVRIEANDNIIKNSNNVARTMWSLIGSKNDSRNGNSLNFSSDEFNSFFASAAHETLKDLGDQVFDPVGIIPVVENTAFSFSEGWCPKMLDTVNISALRQDRKFKQKVLT